MGLAMDHDVEVARRSSRHAGFALAHQAQPGAVVHPGRHLDLEGLQGFHPARTAASATGIADDLTGTRAGVAGTVHPEKSLLEGHLSGSPAGGADLRRRTGVRPGPAAGLAAAH